MAGGRILILVARAEHIRRRQLLTRLLLRVIPAVAGGLLIAAALVRLTHAPLFVFWIVLAAAVAGVVVFAWFKGSVPAVTDAAASQLDADAGLDGELRSAHWFASHPAPAAGAASQHDWTAFHLAGAADRVQNVSWPSVYPTVKTARAWAGSALLALSAIALVLTSAWPAAEGDLTAGRSRAAASRSGVGGPLIPADLQTQIDELLRSVQSGALPLDAARARVSELRDALSELDPKLQVALAKAAQNQSQKPGMKEDPQTAALASRAEKAAADANLPQDMKWSLEDLAAKLTAASRRPAEPSGEKNAANQDAKSSQSSAAQDSAAGQKQDAGSQMTRTTAADSQSTQMMVTTAAASEAQSRGEENDAAKNGQAGQALDLKALRKETIEADADSQGENVLAEMRRKSEQSRSTLSFTRVAPLAAYDPSHASPPPPPPDALRALVKQYFIRK